MMETVDHIRAEELKPVSKVIETIEQQDHLDRYFAPSAKIAGKLTSGTTVKNALPGTWLGHSLHPQGRERPGAGPGEELTAGSL